MAKPPAPPRRAEPRPALGSMSDAERRSVEQLAQVEGAIAALEGRDAERGLHTALARRERERVQKELQTVAGAADRHAEASSRRRLAKGVAIGVGGLLLLAGLGRGGLVLRDRLAAAAALDAAAARAAQPFREAGFQRVESRTDAPFVLESERGRCFVAVATSASGPHAVRVERAGVVAESTEGVAWCSCGPTRTTVTAGGPPGAALTLLEAPAGRFGGADGLARVEPRPGAILAETDDRPCVEEAIDALVSDAAAPPAPAAMPEVATRLASFGFTSVAGSDAEDVFVRLPAEASTCFVAVAEREGTPLALRLPGGDRTTGPSGVVALCQAEPVPTSVWPAAPTGVTVVAAPLAAAGGTVGLREALARAGHAAAPIVRTADVLAPDADAILFSGGASPAHVGDDASATLLGLNEPPYLFAFSVADAASAPRLGPPAAVACAPPLETSPTSALCLGGAGVFDGAAGVRAQRPEWLRIGGDRASLERALALTSLARRLALSEFELTTVGSFTETGRGAEVVGRAGETELVGVVLGGRPATIHTLSDGPAWTLGGEPRVIALEPGARVALTATPPLPPGGGGDRRVFVFFRR